LSPFFPQVLMPNVRSEYEAMTKEPKVRETLLLLLGQCYKQKGPIWAKKRILKGSEKALQDSAQKAFETAGFDKQTAKGLSSAFRKCCGSEPREPDLRVTLELPEDVVNAMGDLDSKTWKKRKEAMEMIALECDGLDVKMNDSLMNIAKALSECLADKNVANKPIAANTLQVRCLQFSEWQREISSYMSRISCICVKLYVRRICTLCSKSCRVHVYNTTALHHRLFLFCLCAFSLRCVCFFSTYSWR